jgi:acetyl-CoA acetyltransferase
MTVAVAIVGVGETTPHRRDPRPIAELSADACRAALAEAGLRGGDVDGLVSEAFTFGARVPPDDVAHRIGTARRPFTAQVGIAGAGTVGALPLAQLAIEAGLAEVVISYYALNLSRRSGDVYGIHAEEPAKASFEMPMGHYGQPVYFGAQAQRYAHEYGLRAEELGAVAISARRHAGHTPNALERAPLGLDDYLASPMIATPLRKLDCCLVNDCGVAFVVTSLERARDLPTTPVVVAGVGFASKPVTQAQYFTQGDILATAAVDSGRDAYRRAGLGPDDVDVAEVYDCSTISMLLQLEDLGLAPRGGGAAQAAEGRFDPGGALPLNTHGGLLSQSYSVGAGHVVEAVRQLRGERGPAQVEGAEVALACGLGAPEHATAVLTVDR